MFVLACVLECPIDDGMVRPKPTVELPNMLVVDRALPNPDPKPNDVGDELGGEGEDENMGVLE